MIVSRTPMRMSFAGGGSDLSSYYRLEGGAVLSTSIDKYMYISVNKKFDGDIRLSYSITEDVESVSQLKHPIVRNTLNFLNINGGIEIASMADIPSKGSGLGSSSSYTVGLLHALHAYQERYISKSELGALASHIEIDLCGEPIGKQDQYAAAFGGLNLIKFNPDESVSVEPVICKSETINKIEESIIVFYTGQTRSASALLKEQSNNMALKEKQILMKEMVKSAYDLKQILESGDIDSFGPLLDRNWRLKTQLVSGITNPQIEGWYRSGMKSGAEGGKILGAGNGGFLMFFAPKEKHNSIKKALKELKELPISFDKMGSQIVYYQPANTRRLWNTQ